MTPPATRVQARLLVGVDHVHSKQDHSQACPDNPSDRMRGEGGTPLDPGVARLVESIALTLAAEHHALEITQNHLPSPAKIG